MTYFLLFALAVFVWVKWMSRDITPEEAEKLRKRRGLN